MTAFGIKKNKVAGIFQISVIINGVIKKIKNKVTGIFQKQKMPVIIDGMYEKKFFLISKEKIKKNKVAGIF